MMFYVLYTCTKVESNLQATLLASTVETHPFHPWIAGSRVQPQRLGLDRP